MTKLASLLWLSKNLASAQKSGASTFTLKKNAGVLFKHALKQTTTLEHDKLTVVAKKFEQKEIFIYMWICT